MDFTSTADNIKRFRNLKNISKPKGNPTADKWLKLDGQIVTSRKFKMQQL